MIWGLAAAHSDTRFLLFYRPNKFARSFCAAIPPNASRRLLLNEGRARGATLFHGLNQRISSTRYRHTVSTFHDLFVLSGDYSTPEFRSRFAAQAREAAARSELIIAVSRFTASQVEQFLRVEPSRIRVIPHGVNVASSAPSLPRENLILFVGAIQSRKNVARLIEAFERTSAEWKLTLAGAPGYGAAEILARIERSPRRADIHAPGFVSTESLQRLYQTASIFAFPSLDEGFGIPVLEAMAAGVPVITSTTSALPEVAGDAALLVDPTDVDSIANALDRLMRDEALRRIMAAKGIHRAAGFTWESAVAGTWDVYKELGS